MLCGLANSMVNDMWPGWSDQGVNTTIVQYQSQPELVCNPLFRTLNLFWH